MTELESNNHGGPAGVNLLNMNLQSSSPFFRVLPPELRHKIYQALWGSTQHIYMSASSPSGPLAHVTCITDPHAEDEREKAYFALLMSSSSAADNNHKTAWRARQYTDWCQHWKCEEQSPDPARSGGLIGPLLACKRMYDESIGFLYAQTTFSFINAAAMGRFLDVVPRESLSLVPSLHLVWREGGVLHESGQVIELDGSDDEARSDVAWLSAWSRLWLRLNESCTRLSEVSIWYYGRLPRFPMPGEPILNQVENSGVCKNAAVTIHMVWTWETETLVVEGETREEGDDGAVIPDYLRGRGFRVTRIPSVELEFDHWTAMWARPENRQQGLSDVISEASQGWGVREAGPREQRYASYAKN